jgi:hypothetical protein
MDMHPTHKSIRKSSAEVAVEAITGPDAQQRLTKAYEFILRASARAEEQSETEPEEEQQQEEHDG